MLVHSRLKFKLHLNAGRRPLTSPNDLDQSSILSLTRQATPFLGALISLRLDEVKPSRTRTF